VILPTHKQSLRKTIKLFIILFIVTSVALSSLGIVLYHSEIDSIFDPIKDQETFTVTLQENLIREQFDSIISDLLFLSRQNELTAFLNTGDAENLGLIEAEYKEIAQHAKIYGQLRYLDNSGQEKIRVNYDKGEVQVARENELQNKSNRYYFTDTLQLAEKEVFVSPLDLNIENGQIERPFKPVIRFGTPVFDSENTKSGVVLINYLANRLLNDIAALGKLSIGSEMLINEEGYWLLNQRDQKRKWGFMFAEHKEQKFPTYFPEEWAIINNTKVGQLETDNGLFTYKIISPLMETVAAGSCDHLWVIVSHVPPTVLSENQNRVLWKLFLYGAGLHIFIALACWFAALNITRNKLHKLELIHLATRDALTSLANRRMCFERLSATIDHAKRFHRKVGIVYLDLDGFKEINDTMGHAAGDELLIKISEILTSISRSSDTIARLGGDEFVCVLTEINSTEGALHAGQKIIDALNEPIDLTSGRVFIGASVGVSIYPDHGTEPEKLVKMADTAMYESKKKGKNCCTSYSAIV